MMRSFEDAADQLAELIEVERAEASELVRQRLIQLEGQFSAFRNAAFAAHAENETINAQAKQELQNLHYTLRQAGIYYTQGRLAFGEEWGAVIRGFRSPSASVPPPELVPRDIMGALQRQRREDGSMRAQDLAQISWLQHEIAAQNRDLQFMGESGFPLTEGLVDSKFSLKRTISERPQPVAKRPRQTFTRPGSTAIPLASNRPSSAFPPCPPSAPLVLNPCLRISRPAACSAPSMTYIYPDTPLTAPPVIEHWKCALVEAKITSEARTPPRSVLPPLVAFAGGHSCSYYMWFAIRSFLFPQLENPPPSPVHKTWTTEEWEAKLHNKKSGHLDHKYDARLFDKDGGSCACGVPPFDSNVLRKLSMRVDGTPVQAADFESHSLQAGILADLESGRAKLQFEQTDDIVLDILLWSPQQLSNRIEARRNIFRNSWDLSVAANPLEKADIRDRRPWITQFRDLLQEWPNFADTGPSPAALDDADSTDLDSLLAYEQRLITFYLKTVSETLGLCPTLPRQRPNADALPELYRNLVP